MNLEHPAQNCKYSIVCPEKKENTSCNPLNCKAYQVYEKNISEKELSKAILEEFVREDMGDF